MTAKQKGRSTTLKSLLEHAVIQELMGPVDGRLRKALLWSGGMLGAGLVATLWLERFFWSIAFSGFFGDLGRLVIMPFTLLATPVGIGLLIVSLILWFCTAWYTDGFERGKFEWHYVGNGLVAAGSVTTIALILPLLNLIVSILATILVLAIVLAILGGA